MNSHTLFYYPYGLFYNAQAPLLKAAALYFDKLYILDPEKASGGGIGAIEGAEDVKLLEQCGILERVAPEEVLHNYEDVIVMARNAAKQATCRYQRTAKRRYFFCLERIVY